MWFFPCQQPRILKSNVDGQPKEQRGADSILGAWPLAPGWELWGERVLLPAP